MGSDPQSYLAYNEEVAHRECAARIKALEEGRDWHIRHGIALAKAHDELKERAENAEGALQVAAVHNVELQAENDSQMTKCALAIRIAHQEIDRLVLVRDRLQAENDSLKARVAELEEALRPFARFAELISPETNEDSNFATYRRDRVTVGDLRRAARALGGKKDS